MIQLGQKVKDRVYEIYLNLTRRLSDSQTMAILAIIVGVPFILMQIT